MGAKGGTGSTQADTGGWSAYRAGEMENPSYQTSMSPDATVTRGAYGSSDSSALSSGQGSALAGIAKQLIGAKSSEAPTLMTPSMLDVTSPEAGTGGVGVVKEGFALTRAQRVALSGYFGNDEAGMRNYLAWSASRGDDTLGPYTKEQHMAARSRTAQEPFITPNLEMGRYRTLIAASLKGMHAT